MHLSQPPAAASSKLRTLLRRATDARNERMADVTSAIVDDECLNGGKEKDSPCVLGSVGQVYLSGLSTATGATSADLLGADSRWIRLILSVLSLNGADLGRQFSEKQETKRREGGRGVALRFFRRSSSGSTAVECFTIELRHDIVQAGTYRPPTPPPPLSSPLPSSSSPVSDSTSTQSRAPCVDTNGNLTTTTTTVMATILADISDRVAAGEQELCCGQLRRAVALLEGFYAGGGGCPLETTTEGCEQYAEGTPSDVDGVGADTDADADADAAFHVVSVPVYRVLVEAPDTAATRLASIYPLTNALLSGCCSGGCVGDKYSTDQTFMNSSVRESSSAAAAAPATSSSSSVVHPLSTELSHDQQLRYRRGFALLRATTLALKALTALASSDSTGGKRYASVHGAEEKVEEDENGNDDADDESDRRAFALALLARLRLLLSTSAQPLSLHAAQSTLMGELCSAINLRHRHRQQRLSLLLSSSCPVVRVHPSPGALVHCRQGVSRSASVVLVFFMFALRNHLRSGTRRRGCSRQNNYSVDDATGLARKGDEEEEGEEDGSCQLRRLEYADLLAAVRAARPAVMPNMCFAVEMQALWRHLMN